MPMHEYMRVWMMLPVWPAGHEFVLVSGRGCGAVQPLGTVVAGVEPASGFCALKGLLP